MFESYTNRARHVITVSHEQARSRNDHHIGTEHLLLGLLDERDSIAVKVLEGLGVHPESVRAQVEEVMGRGGHRLATSGHLPFTARLKKVLELSQDEARRLGHQYVGTEHLLLGLAAEGEGVAADVLVRNGAPLGQVRKQVVALLSGAAEQPSTEGHAGESTESITARLDRIEHTLATMAETLEAVLRRLSGGG